MATPNDYFQGRTDYELQIAFPTGLQYVPFEVAIDIPAEALYVFKEVITYPPFSDAGVPFGAMSTQLEANQLEITVRADAEYLIGGLFVIAGATVVLGKPFNAYFPERIVLNRIVLPGKRPFLGLINWSGVTQNMRISAKVEIYNKNVLQAFKPVEILQFSKITY